MKKTILAAIILALIGGSENAQKLDTAINASRDGLALIKDSKVDEGRKKLLEAKNHYAELVASAPQNGLYNNNYGWMLMKLGEYEEAEKYLTIANQNKSSVSPISAPSENLKELETLVAKQ